MPDNSVIDTQTMQDFLINLLHIHSPTGFTDDAIAYAEQAFRDVLAPFPGVVTRRTHKGALLIDVPGQNANSPVGLTAHLDTLGLMVTQIKSSGRLKVTNLGGIVWSGVEMEGVTVHTRGNGDIRGSVVPVNGSVHVNRSLRKMERNEDTLEIRLDAATTSAAETQTLGVRVGDYVFLDTRTETTAGFVRSRFLDDKAGVACIYGALAALAKAGTPPTQNTSILISNYEEVGHGGAHWSNDLFEVVAVDMAAVGEGQNSDEYHCTVCVKDSSGPYHNHTVNRLLRVAAAQELDVKTDIYPYYSSDGSAYWRAGGAARVGLVGPGVDTSHGYERTHTDALRQTAALLAAYLLDG